MKIYLLNIEKLKSDFFFQRAYELVDTQRKKKVDACKREEDKRRSLGAGLLLAYGLSKALQVSWSEIKKQISFEYGEYEKPYLQPWKGICFNISHSGNYVVCVIFSGKSLYEYEENKELGIDIQKITPCNMRTAKKAFNVEVCKQLEAQLLEDEDKAAIEFTTLWTNKESRGKLFGTGVFLPDNQNKRVFQKNYRVGKEYMISVSALMESFPDNVCEVEVEDAVEV